MNKKVQIKKNRIIKTVRRSSIFLSFILCLVFFTMVLSTLLKNSSTICGTISNIGHSFGSNYWIVLKINNKHIKKQISIYEYQLYRHRLGESVCID